MPPSYEYEDVCANVRAAAEARTLLTYTDAYGGDRWAARGHSRIEMGRLVMDEHISGRPLLTVVVVEKAGKHKGRPGPGLFKIAKEHDAGLTQCRCGVPLVLVGESEPAFVARQLELVYEWWAPADRRVGTTYRPPNLDPHAKYRDPFPVDPDDIDRSNRGHALTQTALHDFVVSLGFEPRSWDAHEPRFDVAWDSIAVTYVAEVKSLTARNEHLQLRLGLGQVLDYQDALTTKNRRVIAVLAVEREPKDMRWLNICARQGVVLVWPGHFEGLGRTDTGL